MSRNVNIKKVLVIGSGPIVIGQAAEFDYAGVQACRSLREEGVEVVLVNSNPATIMTDEDIADKVYIEPLTVECLIKIIEKEKPDGILAGLGGQTGLNLALQLYELDVLEKYNTKLLGTKIDSIKNAEDRELFKSLMLKINEPIPESDTVSDFEGAKKFAAEIGFPIIVRPAYTLGGSGGGIATNEQEYEEIVNIGLSLSPISQVLVEKSIAGFKEIEYEVMRDANDTCITVCNMENIDPIGIHTGDSIVVAPSQTLTNKEYQMLRTSAIKIIRALKIEGGCNVQYALDPSSNQYYVIEVNPRVSRSSALASKATGYPIAKIASKIAIGYNLDELQNSITRKTSAAFEPALDYVVVKIPKWPFDKFAKGDRVLGTKMKATGEVMAIGRTFESAFQKALASIESKDSGLLQRMHLDCSVDELKALLHVQDDRRIFRVAEALKRGMKVEDVSKITKIDKWFISKIKRLTDFSTTLEIEPLTRELYLKAKEKGFLDSEISYYSGKPISEKLCASFKTVDTCAAEFRAQTPYFYSAYGEKNESEPLGNSILILGSGPIRIGQGIEFDYCSVHAAWAAKKNGYKSIIVNSNPETLSTDFDVADKLYFEPMNIENIMNIIELEKPHGVFVQFGGQTAINLAPELHKRGVKILGTSLESTNIAEDRKTFTALLKKLEIPQPKGAAVLNAQEAVEVASALGFPLLVRPSYVIGGRGMQVVYDEKELLSYIHGALKFSNGHPILIDRYIEGYEVELDAISDGENVLIPGINEHIEKAGVHSGDSICVYPIQKVSKRTASELIDYTQRIAKELKIKGLMNIQFVLKGNTTYVIEVNPRASRTVPIMSKVTQIPMVEIATNAILGKSIVEQGFKPGLAAPSDLICAKIPIFSFQKLNRIDPALAPEMKSTGEVLGLDNVYEKALIKGFLAAGYEISDKRGNVLISINDHFKEQCVQIAKTLTELGYKLIATVGTHNYLKERGINSKEIENFDIEKIKKDMKDKKLSFVINTPSTGDRGKRYGSESRGFLIRTLAELYSTPCFSSLETARAYLSAVSYFEKDKNIECKTVSEYIHTTEPDGRYSRNPYVIHSKSKSGF